MHETPTMKGTNDMYEQADRTFTDDNWRSTTYRRKDGSEFRVAVPPVRVMRNEGFGRVFLDRITWNERSEHEMASRLASHAT